MPVRHDHFGRLIDSLEPYMKSGIHIKVLINQPSNHESEKMQKTFNRKYGHHANFSIDIYDSDTHSIPEGRNHLIKTTNTPFFAGIDDDLVIQGKDVFKRLENILRRGSLAMIGLPSYNIETPEILFKPREKTPKFITESNKDILFMKVEGMFFAGFTELFKDIDGFCERRRFWGEWTELNNRLTRLGYATGMFFPKDIKLLHDEKALGSPTRDRSDKKEHLLYGVLAMLIEHGVGSEGKTYKDFRDVLENVNDTYVKEYFSSNLSIERLLYKISKDVVTQMNSYNPNLPFLMPKYHNRAYVDEVTDIISMLGNSVLKRLQEDWKEILLYREARKADPFDFMPLVDISDKWPALITRSKEQLTPYLSRIT